MASKPKLSVGLARLAVLAAGASLWGAAAQAQVMEIADDGSYTLYTAPAVYTSEGVRPILAAPQAPATITTRPDLTAAIASAASRHAVSPNLIEAVAWNESRFRQDAVSPKGAVGVMQLMDSTARLLGVDRNDLRQNIEGGAAYLGQLLHRYGGSVPLALAAYNAGPGAVDRYRGIPPYAETQAYVRTILSRLNLPRLTFPLTPSVISITP